MNIDSARIQNLDNPEKAFELDNVAVRLVRTREPLMSDEIFDSPDSVVRALSEQMRDFDREVLGIINLDNRMRPINVSFVSAGSVNGTLSHPREILKAAILSNAANMMLIHNHPSGYLIPSKMDVQITDRMIQLCDLVNIPLLDHIIVGGDKEEYFSFAGQKIMPMADNYFTENFLNIEFTNQPNRQEQEMPDDYNGLMPAIEEPQAAYNRDDRVREITEQPLENVTESVTLQQSKEMMSAALGSTDELLSLYKDNNSRTVAQAVNVVAEERAEYNNKLTVKQAIENRQHTHYGAYADIGTALDKFSTDELIDYLRKNEPGGEGSLRGYVESQIIGAQINRERYSSDYEYVTESVTNDMPDEPDIEQQAAGLRI